MKLKGWLAVAASVVLGAVAFAVPATAEVEPVWFDDKEKEAPTILKPKVLTLGGELTITSVFSIGPCELSMESMIYNNGELGEGSMLEGGFGACPTSLPGCSFKMGEAENTPWNIKLTGGLKFAIEGVKVNFATVGECAKYGVPANLTMTGTATGIYNNEENEFEFFENDDLMIGGFNAFLEGSLHTGTKLTVE